jgi:exopolysaccharide biosynthesis polyprenyl glycosylphosphotransferase
VSFLDRETILRRVSVAADLGVIGIAFLVALAIRDHLVGFGFRPLGPPADQLWIALLAMPIWVGCLRAVGLYRSVRHRSRRALLRDLAKAQTVAALLLLSVPFVFGRWEVSRLLVHLFLALSFLGLAIKQLLLADAVRRRLPGGFNSRQALVVGAPDRVARYIEFLRAHPYWDVQVVGVADDAGPGARGDVDGVPVLGRTRDLPEIIRSRPTDEVAFAIGPREFPHVEQYLDLCQEMGVTSRLILDLPQKGWTHQDVAWVDGVGIVSLEPVRQSTPALAFKRAIDVAGALVGLVVLGAAYLWCAPRIRRDSPGPVFFSQVRVGQNGRLFALYKFRTMYVDAEARLAELQRANEMHGAVFKLRDDPRITSTGKWLRARHLDELPQFWNVLRGQMSLVGTRPPTLDEVDTYRPHHRRRLSMRPGITGLWQLAGNDAVRDFEEVVRLDCRYIDSWSIWLDTKILVKTVLKVVRRTGW